MANTKKRISDLPLLENLTAEDVIIITDHETQVSYQANVTSLITLFVPLLDDTLLYPPLSSANW
jgi:hypothetical protein